MERVLSRDVRGRILRILEINYPFKAGDHLIADILQDAQYSIAPQLVAGHLTYLEEKGYIETETVEAKELGMTRVLAKLTPKGVDLLDGNIPADPGVRLP